MIPFIDLKKQYECIKPEIDAAIAKVCEHGQFILGPEVEILERKLADFVDSRYALAVASGTDALMLALMSLEIGPGDEVIVPDFSFFATCEVVSLLQATPIFCDIEEGTYNISVDSIKERLSPKTKAIIPVSMFGQCPDLAPIMEIGASEGIKVIEDGAQSFGAKYSKQNSLSIADLSCCSFFPAKPLGAFGDAGAIFTNDDKLFECLKRLRNHGQQSRYYHTHIGVNARLDSIQAAVLIEKLKLYPKEMGVRKELAQYYMSHLDKNFKLPEIRPHNRSSWAQFSIRCEKRDQLAEALKKVGIPTSVHYPHPLSRQPVYQGLYNSFNPVVDKVCREVISLPLHAYLKRADQDFIIENCNKFYKVP